jgi:hypothetical protein
MPWAKDTSAGLWSPVTAEAAGEGVDDEPVELLVVDAGAAAGDGGRDSGDR